MSNILLTELTELITIASEDLFYCVDISDTTESDEGTSKKVDLAHVFDSYTGNSSLVNTGTILSGSWIATKITAEYIGNHASTHELGGSDEIKLDELASTNINTDLNANYQRHGLLSNIDNDTGHYLSGTNRFLSIPNDVPLGMIKIYSVLSTGNISGTIKTSTGYAAIRWWDGTTSLIGSGSSTTDYEWTKAVPAYNEDFGASSEKIIYFWSSTAVNKIQSGNITSFNCASNNITKLSFNNLSSLVSLYCNENKLTSLDLREETHYLQTLDCSNNPNLIYLNIKRAISLRNIDCSNCNLSSINLYDIYSSLELFDISNNPLTEILSNEEAFDFSSSGYCNLSNCQLSESALLVFSSYLIPIEEPDEGTIDISGNPGVTTAVINAMEALSYIVIS
jgi:hypothetical protein